MRAWSRPRSDPEGAAALAARLRAAGVRSCDTLEAAVGDADLVFAAVPAAAAVATATACLPWLARGCVYADPSPLAPSAKARLADELAGAGARFADVAVLGSVAAAGADVPMLAAGPGAAPLAELLGPPRFDVRVLEGPAGRAALVKLVRSVYTKGRDALVLELVLAARRLGVEREVLGSIGGPGEEVPFPELVDRILRSLAAYSGRRAQELGASAELLEEAEVDPLLTRAARERLERLEALGLRERFHGDRAASAEQVLAELERPRP